MLHAQALSVRIETARLALVPLGPEHASPLFEPTQDPSIYVWISATPPASVEAQQASWTHLALHQTRTIAGNDTIRGVAVDDVEYRLVERHKDEQRIDSS